LFCAEDAREREASEEVGAVGHVERAPGEDVLHGLQGSGGGGTSGGWRRQSVICQVQELLHELIEPISNNIAISLVISFDAGSPPYGSSPHR
jgi:hypothetical protein